MKPVKFPLRLNMQREAVADLHAALAALDFEIDPAEVDAQRFGPTTRAAVTAFQAKARLGVSGDVDAATARALTRRTRPAADQAAGPIYRVRGTLRDERGRPIGRRTVRVFEKTLTAEELIAEKTSYDNGFYDIPFPAPMGKKKPKETFNIVVKTFDDQGELVASSPVIFNPPRTAWVNFNAGRYQGTSALESLDKALRPYLEEAGVDLTDIAETEADRQVSYLAKETSRPAQEIMSLLLAAHLRAATNLTVEPWFAFIAQNLPTSLPGDLLEASALFTRFDGLVEIALDGIVAMEPELQRSALEKAVADSVVPQPLADHIDQILALLAALRADRIAAQPFVVGKAPLADVLQLSALDGRQRTTFVNLLAAHQGNPEEFWAAVAESAEFDEAAVADVRTTLEVGLITKNHLPFLEHVKGRIGGDGDLASERDLAKLDFDGWLGLIDDAQQATGGNAIPDNLDGVDGQELAEVYATVLMDRAEAAFPTVAVAARAAGDLAHGGEIVAFVDAHQDLDLRFANVDRYVSEMADDPNAIFADPAAAIGELKGLQRTLLIAGKPRQAAALWQAGLRSAGAVASLTEQQFAELAVAAGFTGIEAQVAHANAGLRYAMSLARFGEFNLAFGRETPAAIITTPAALPPEMPSAPTLENLFGSLDFCRCQHCDSVLSPAAYFVDILRFLDLKAAEQANQSARTVLFERRGDLGHIKLSCENTNTVMPYIDLVCEILEESVQASGVHFQSTLSSAELRAHPEYVNGPAYDELKAAVFPMTLPFDLWLAEARHYLRHLQIERHELMRVLRAPAGPSDAEMASEYFDITPVGATQIVTAAAGDQAQFWDTANPVADLANVETFLDRSGLEYDELVDLLLVRFVNPPGVNRTVIQRPADDCDVGEQRLTNLSAARLDLMHRFLRAWRGTGYPQWELDLLIRNAAVGSGQLDGPALRRLQRFHQLQKRLGLGTEELLAFYGDINTEVRVTPDGDQLALYHRLFLNRTVTNPTNPQFELAAITVGPPAAIADHQATVLAAISITQADLALLAPANGELTVANLSAIYRRAALARALRMPVADLLRFDQVRQVADPFASIEATWALVEDVDAIRARRATPEQLAYLLRHEPDSPIGMSDTLIAQHIESVRAARFAVENEFAVGDDALEDVVVRGLQRFDAFQDPADLRTAVRIIDGSWSTATDGEPAISDPDRVAFINDNFATFADPGAAAATLGALAQPAGPAREAEVQDRFAWVLARLKRHFGANAIKEQVATLFRVERGQADVLLSKLELAGQAGTTLLQHLSAPALTAVDPATGTFQNPVTRPQFPRLFETMVLVHKAAQVVNRFGITPPDLAWLVDHAAAVGVLGIGALPVAPGQPVAFARWRDLSRLLDFKAAFPTPPDGTLFDILDMCQAADPVGDVLDALADLTGWDRTDLESVATRINLQYPADYLRAATYVRLREAFDLLRRGGAGATVMAGWAGAAISAAHAQQIKQATKAKYSVEQWLDVSTDLQDHVRELKRAALVDYLVARPPDKDPNDAAQGKAWDDPNGLFAWFLIDVEMTSCFLTSRLKQAISSVQLFVQRVLLNLENERVVAHPNRGWEQWKWMKNYRVWEANRKVFLYPENWIEPELRDDKTPFFEELEKELLQAEITDPNVERALRGYVTRLDGVGRLEVVGAYHHVEPGTNDLYVLARTRELPHLYYYRTWVNDAHWTAWQAIDLEIEAEQVIPYVVDRKLHLFWLDVKRMPRPTQFLPPTPAALPEPGKKAQKPPKPPEYLEIQLAWSALDNGVWSGKRLGKLKLIHPWLRPEASYHLRTWRDGQARVHIDLMINSSREFNETTFYDPITNDYHLLTDTKFDENEWPWHSSTFIFDGDVVEVWLNDINGSWTKVRSEFGPDGRPTRRLTASQKRPRLKQPAELRYQHGRLVNHEGNTSNVNVLKLQTQRIDSGRLLRKASDPFSIVANHQSMVFDSVTQPFFFQDQMRAFFVRPQREWRSGGSFTTVQPSDASTPFRVRYTFYPFYHPYTRLLGRQLDKLGVEGVLNRPIQVDPASIYPWSSFAFNAAYNPYSLARPLTQGEVMDFTYAGAYSQYNWELFFHAPLLIADRLRRNQKFEDALRWFHFIFDPTSPSADPVPKRYWITKPFYEYNSADYQQQRIDRLLQLVNQGSTAHAQQVAEWRANPFKPHLLARLRPVAYQRTVVMKYITNLIEWGDQLFRRDSIESINEATQLYVLASEILGDRPVEVPPAARADDKTFLELLPELDAFSNAMAEIENTAGLPVEVVTTTAPGGPPLPPPEAFYFCIPHNERLLKYWDDVADRLFKIRHCMNIEGVVRQLPLFEPPIDPALLVKAAAAGIDLGSVLSEIDVALPHYRFSFMIPRAQDFANEVKMLGSALLQALERRDAEELAALRATHEVSVAEATLAVREKEIEDAENAIDALRRSREVVAVREAFYSSREFNIPAESGALELQASSSAGEGKVSSETFLAGILGVIPSFSVGVAGFGGTPNVTVGFGGSNLASIPSASAGASSAGLRALDKDAAAMTTRAGYERRDHEWKFQLELAERELHQIDAQIAGAEIRLDVARQQLRVQQDQLDNAREVDEHMRSKYTNAELYEWMLSQVSSVYFQAYQLAYDVAKRAERTFRYELGVTDSSYVNFGYWDSLKKGLLAGEKLSLDLIKLEAAYIERNRRELELTKHVSLAQVAPAALLELKETGSCVIELPELLFDMDYPGHYFRRLKSVTVTIPCVTGPYTGVHCTLSLLRNSVRSTGVVGGAGYDRTGPDDGRFRDQLAAVQSIATSSAQDDGGLFVLDFRDERYLPFEGAGAISRWSISLPKDTNHFDFDSIADVVLHLRYTARDGGATLAAAARQSVQAALPTAGVQLVDLKREFPDEWHAFLHPAGAGAEHEIAVTFTAQHFPFFARSKTITVTRAQLVGRMASAGDYEVVGDPVAPGAPLTLSRDGLFGTAHHGDQNAPGAGWQLGDWTFKVKRATAPDFTALPDGDVDELFLLLHYELSN